MKYALVGNPNCGKTSLFNTLTGSRAKVANLPGVTVDPIMARLRTNRGVDSAVDLIDLPGTYSLHPKAPDEAVTRDALFDPNTPTGPMASSWLWMQPTSSATSTSRFKCSIWDCRRWWWSMKPPLQVGPRTR